jgi:hypothetical protein
VGVRNFNFFGPGADCPQTVNVDDMRNTIAMLVFIFVPFGV